MLYASAFVVGAATFALVALRRRRLAERAAERRRQRSLALDSDAKEAKIMAVGGASCPVAWLGQDALAVIIDLIADPLVPTAAVALSSTCKGLWAPLRRLPALEVLKHQHLQAVALISKMKKPSCSWLAAAETLYFHNGSSFIRLPTGSPPRARVLQNYQLVLRAHEVPRKLNVDDLATLGMVFSTNGLPRLQDLTLSSNYFGDQGVQALCKGMMSRGAAHSLRYLDLSGDYLGLGPAAAEALAAIIQEGVLPNLERLDLIGNPLGNQGVAALAVPLRKLQSLKVVHLEHCDVGDEGVASLMADLVMDDFRSLERLHLQKNKYMTHEGWQIFNSAVSAGMMRRLDIGYSGLTIDSIRYGY